MCCLSIIQPSCHVSLLICQVTQVLGYALQPGVLLTLLLGMCTTQIILLLALDFNLQSIQKLGGLAGMSSLNLLHLPDQLPGSILTQLTKTKDIAEMRAVRL